MSYRTLQKLCNYYYHEKYRFEAIKRHDRILTMSSGINHLPAPAVLKRNIVKEYDDDRFYTSYTDHCGSKLFLSSVYFEYSNCANANKPRIHPQKNICRTIGATGALSSVIEYLGSTGRVTTALVLGLNYSLFTLWYEKYGIKYRILKSLDENRVLPRVDEALEAIGTDAPDMIILTQPTNPSGEVYSKDELRVLVNDALGRGIWVLIDDVPNLHNTSDTTLPIVFEVLEQSEYPENLIFVSSFSKSRSLAGLRFGYVICNPTIQEYLYHLNDDLFWSPQHVASCALSKDILYRLVARRTQSADAAIKTKELNRLSGQYSHSLKLMSPYADDMSRFEDNFSYLNAGTPFALELEQYEQELKSVYDVYTGNWNAAVEVLGRYMIKEVTCQHGFNHCFMVDSSLDEGRFCIELFEKTGIDLYTQSVFDEGDELDKKQFFVRLSCALKTEHFHAGLERLEGFFSKNCCPARG